MDVKTKPERLNRVKEALKMRGISQVELAIKMNYSQNAVTQICNNHTQPHLSVLKQIADILEVHMRELIA